MRRLVRASLNSSIRSPRDLAKHPPPIPEPAPSTSSPSTSEHTTAWLAKTAEKEPFESPAPIHWLVLVPYRFHDDGFNFDPIVREFKEDETRVIIRRFMKRGGGGGGGLANPTARGDDNDVHSPEVLIASRVVSRSHAEIWCESGGEFYIRDICSSSGTFLNRERLAEAGKQSPAVLLRDGDVLQLGVDYEDGVEVMDRAVKIRVVIGHGKRRIGPSRREGVVEGSPPLDDGRPAGFQDLPINALLDPSSTTQSFEDYEERLQHQLSGVSLLTHAGQMDNSMVVKVEHSLETSSAIEDGFPSAMPQSRSSLPYLVMTLDPDTAPPRYRTPSPIPPPAPLETPNPRSSSSSLVIHGPPSPTDPTTPTPANETDLTRYVSKHRNMISPDLERKLIRAHYMPEDDPDEISAQEWQTEYGVGYFELKRLRQLYARYSNQESTGM